MNNPHFNDSDDERNELLEYEVKVTSKTALAILVWDGSSEVWFPLSKIEGGDELDRGEEGTIRVPRWLAENRGWA